MTKRSRWLSRSAIATVGMLMVLSLGQAAVSAHTTDWITHGRDSAYVHSDHSTVTVCDNERDGHYVYAELRTWYNGDPVKDREADGGDAGCDTETFFFWTYTEFRLCEEGKGCTDWYST